VRLQREPERRRTSGWKGVGRKETRGEVEPQILSKYLASYTFRNPQDLNSEMHFNVALDGGALFMAIGGQGQTGDGGDMKAARDR